MREFKFRAWERVWNYCSSKKMHYFDFIDVHREGYSDALYHWDFKDSPIMQYVGIKDKNDKEIYEEDIVKIYISNEYKESTYHIVKWIGSDYPAFDLKPSLSEEYNSFSFLFNEFDDLTIEVIGNIYENPELLKEIGE